MQYSNITVRDKASVDYMPKHNDSQFSIAITVTVSYIAQDQNVVKPKYMGRFNGLILTQSSYYFCCDGSLKSCVDGRRSTF